jgi:hypothetical protein
MGPLVLAPPTIQSQTITFTAPTSPVTYGVSPITLSATASSGLAVTFSLDATSTPGAASLSGTNNSVLTITGVGTVVIDANQAGNSNYSAAAQVQRSIVVNPASVNITASSPTVTYGAAVPAITASFSAFQNGQTSSVLTTQPTCITAYTVTSNAGSSPSTSCSGAAAANYSFTYTNGAVTINKAPLTVTANNASMAVGAALPTFTASYSGFQNGQSASVLSGSPSLTTTATSSSPAGTYPIVAALGTLSAQNYAFTTFVNGTLSIVASPTVVISTSATLSGSASAGYTATITITNSGTGAASNVVLSTATLGTVTGTPLPQSIASIAAGGSKTFTVSFSGTAGANGAGVAEKYSGTYTGGSFSASVRSVTLP